MELKVITREAMVELLGKDYERLSWGYFFPASATGAVGARLILEPGGYLSTVPGRTAFSGRELDEEASAETGRLKIVPTLEKFFGENGIRTDSDAIVYGENEGYRLLATPNASYGYVYLSFWKV